MRIPIILLLVLLHPMVASAKRGPKPQVPPVQIGAFELRADNDDLECWNLATGKQLWERKAYTTIITPFVETDCQWDFIKSMTFQSRDDTLWLTTEKGRKFRADLKVTKLNDQPSDVQLIRVKNLADTTLWNILAIVVAIGAVKIFMRRRTTARLESKQESG